MRVYPIQNQFTAGEISPKLHTRNDIAGYAAGVKTLSNFIALRHGSVETRPGTKLVSRHNGYRGRMFEFPISDTLSYAVTLTDEGKLFVNDRSGNLYGDNFGSNQDFLDDLSGWTDESTGDGKVDYIQEHAYFSAHNGKAILKQSLNIANPGQDHLMHIEAKCLRGNVPLTVTVSNNAATFLSVPMAIDKEDMYFVLTGLGARTLPDGTPRTLPDGTPRTLGGTSFDIIVELDGTGLAAGDEEPVWKADHISFHERNGTFTETVFDTPYNVHDLEEMQVEMVPGEDKMRLVTGQKHPYTLDYNGGSWTFAPTDYAHRPEAWNGYINHESDDATQDIKPGYTVEVSSGHAAGGTVGNVYRFTGAAASVDLSAVDYATSGDWDDRGTVASYMANPNFPGSVGFYQGREWLGAFPVTRNSLRSSKSGDYLDLDAGSAADDHSIDITMDDNARVQWIRGEQDLLVGTENGEYVIVSEGGLLTPTDKQAAKQSSNGSAKMQGRPIGNSVAYTSLDGAKIRDMEYKFVVNGWQSRDISFTAEHLFEEYGRVKEIHYAKDPESIIWFVTEFGKLVGCSFDLANDAIGWHRHETDGNVLSACIQKYKGKAELWLLVDRYIAGTQQLYVERMSDDVFMDSSIGFYYSSTTDSIDGFDHLASKTVNVMVDDVQLADVALDASGDGTAPETGNLVQVGLPFTSQLVTLPAEEPGGPNTMAWKKRWSEVFLRLYDSVVPDIQGQTPDEASNDPFTGDVSVLNLGYDSQASLDIQSSHARSCKISGLFGQMNESRS